MRLVSIRVGDIHCEACAASIRSTLSSLEGVLDIRVLTSDKRVVVRYDPEKVSREDLVMAIRVLGFTPED